MKQKYKSVSKLGGALLVVLSTLTAARADYQSTVLSQNPSGYWRLNETTTPPALNTTATNLGSVAVTGTYNGSQGFLRGFPGALASSDTAANFDGSSQSVTNPYNASLSSSTFSIEAWLSAASSSANCVLSDFSGTGGRSGWLIYQTGATGYELRLYHGGGSTSTCFPGNTGLVGTFGTNIVGSYTHVVATFDGTTAKIYINGSLANSSTLVFPYLPGVSDATFSIAMRADTGFKWAGKEDEVAYYSSVLSASDVAAHYAAATTNAAGYAAQILASNPMLYYRLDEPGDPFAINSSVAGATLNGDYASGTTPGLAGPRPSAYPGFESTNYSVGINGNGSTVTVPALNFNTNKVTITGWVYASGAQNDYAGIILCDAGSTYAGLTIDGFTGGTGIGYVWNNNPNSYNWSPSLDSGLPTLAIPGWSFVALVVQPTEADIYIANSADPSSFAGATNYLVHVNQAFDGGTLFGSDAGIPDYSFNGNIDEVAMWNRSLSAGEVYSQFASSVGSVGPKIFTDLQAPPDTVYIGDTLKLSVDVGGSPTLSYQWYDSNGPIQYATNTTYIKANAQLSDSSTYHVVVTNLYGTVTSASVPITVNTAFFPAITTQPSGHDIYPGGTIRLTVVATGGGLKYQWKKGVVPITGANYSTFEILNVTTNDSGVYSVTITNNVGNISSDPVAINVLLPANGYETAIVADKPEAWFRLNETSGIAMKDAMGRHDGIYTNVSGSSVTLGVTGAIVGSPDTAVTFNGPASVSYGYAPYSPDLNAQKFAIEAWVKTTDTVDTLSAVSSRSADFQGYGIWTVPAGNWSGEVSQSGANYYVGSDTAASVITPGVWAHVVMTYDTSLRVYVDGQWDGVGYVDFDRNPSAPFVIGGFGPPSAIARLFNGQVDEVAVYAHALTQAQALNHYALGKFPNPIPPFFVTLPVSSETVSNSAATTTLSGLADGPVPITYQWYKNGASLAGETNASLLLANTYSNAGSYVLRAINPNGYTNAPAVTLSLLPPVPAYVNVTNGLVLHLTFDGNYQDSSGRGNNGTATGTNGSLPSIVTGRIGSGAVSYATTTTTGVPIASNPNGVVTDSSYVTLGNPADLQFGTAADFSVAYWVKLPAGYVNGDLPFLCSSVGSYGNAGFTFAPAYTNGGWSYSLNGVVQLNSTAAAINNGDWHHLLHSVSRTGYANTYLDGVLVDTRLAGGIGNMNTAGPVNIGQDSTGLYPEQGSATVDDMAVWRRALTAYEAYSIYYAATNSNSSFNIPGTVTLNINQVGTNVVLTWNPGATLGILEQADSVAGPWTPAGAYAPYYQVPPTAAQKFYRLNISE
jgi:hypothetical protein